MKYIGQCLVNFLDPINMPNFHLSNLDGNTTSKKILICVLFFEKILESYNKMILHIFFFLLY